ncbi:hypothetical protein BDK51DRAFT_37839 [Blyttiomyces helicus]|uniref:Uncharacterized protein n=1 Tax=Blyttiomyces helicus TaxID=388810 RepID=A0A4P9VXY4_9FUNG|nr:hypothetical protein BDK51DRAFT_37839 [Blyttiomyces helicus]|eukprot:RKO84599.1 hypothetical protein BDK51DRAFT_37839 [Blyttiomyces helicus]
MLPEVLPAAPHRFPHLVRARPPTKWDSYVDADRAACDVCSGRGSTALFGSAEKEERSDQPNHHSRKSRRIRKTKDAPPKRPNRQQSTPEILVSSKCLTLSEAYASVTAQQDLNHTQSPPPSASFASSRYPRSLMESGKSALSAPPKARGALIRPYCVDADADGAGNSGEWPSRNEFPHSSAGEPSFSLDLLEASSFPPIIAYRC